MEQGLEGRKSSLKILAIESSNQTMSTATVEDGLVVAEYTRNGNLQHSTQLMPAVQAVMEKSGWQPQDVDRIAVAEGPGSYTGVRIGATIAKTLAWTLGKPLVPISSLKIIAANARLSPYRIVPLMNARRQQVYTGVYKEEQGRLECLRADAHLSSEAFFQELAADGETYLFIGQDLPLFEGRIQELLQDRALFAPRQEWLPRAGTLACLAEQEEPMEAHLFVPRYLKKSEAEENWQKLHQQEGEGDYVERTD